jgi:type 2 lantibiotic biosynthesis protein LanM
MEAFHEQLIVRAATIDELLSDDFEPMPDRKDAADLAGRRLAAWRRASANGDERLFQRRLERDHLSPDEVLARFASVRRKASAALPPWVEDAVWIEAALQGAAAGKAPGPLATKAVAFEDLLLPVVERAETMLWAKAGAPASDRFTKPARTSLCRMLLEGLSELCVAPFYERFSHLRTAGTGGYAGFGADMRAGGFRRLFEEKPVLLRLIATLTRQWIDATAEFVRRLDDDRDLLRREFLSGADVAVADIEGRRSDRHNDGRSVLIVRFEDGTRVVYKPKDLRLDVAWHALIGRLNASAPPIELRAARAFARDNYGWTEFIEHKGGADREACERFYRRAGAWLALFHCFAATDMHQENIIAAGEYPVPIDLETLLQSPAPPPKSEMTEGAAFDAASAIIANSVSRVGMLPAYGRGPDNSVFGMGGLTSDWNSRIEISWSHINSDEMRPEKTKIVDDTNPNLPHVGGSYAKFGDYFDAFLAGFTEYAHFLAKRPGPADLLGGFAGVPVRKVLRPTRFYSMLLQRLKNHRIMDDGVLWSAEADFVARLSDWTGEADAAWPLHRAERAALVTLNVPHFVLPSDGDEIGDFRGVITRLPVSSGLSRARERIAGFDVQEIAWQAEVIRANAEPAKPLHAASAREIPVPPEFPLAATNDMFVSEANRIAAELSARAIRRGTSAAWMGLDWLGDAEVYQLASLGPDLYNGLPGVGVFLAAHAKVFGQASSAELARAGVVYLRKRLKDRNAARLARSLGIGGAAGLGSIAYGFALMSASLNDDTLLADAHAATQLITDDLIAADKRLDVISGSAGAILCLLRLYRDTQADDVLMRAVKCGEHLLRQDRVGTQGRRTWVGQGFGTQGLNGMSHGAAGFAYALASLAAATGREEFEQAAAECIAFEDASYDADRHNWPDLRREHQKEWPCQWCHGATGIGMARAAMLRKGGEGAALLQTDLAQALAGAEEGWRGKVDTLCCGALGSVEFFCEAADLLDRSDLREVAAKRLAAVLQAARLHGDYRWNSGRERFNLGMFRGLAGVGYTLLRQVDGSLPNVLIWE